MTELKLYDEAEKECLNAFFCPITRDIMRDPVTLISDGHTYENSALKRWFQTGTQISPLTAETVSTNTTPNHALRKAISEFLDKFPEHQKQIMDQKTLEKVINIQIKEILIVFNKNKKINDSNAEFKTESNDIYKLDTSVIEFIKTLKLTKYINVFISNEIYTMDTIKLLTEDDLKEMKFNIGPRRLIYDAIQKLNDNNDRANEPNYNYNNKNYRYHNNNNNNSYGGRGSAYNWRGQRSQRSQRGQRGQRGQRSHRGSGGW